MHTKTELDETADRGLRRISPDSFVGVAAAIALPLSGEAVSSLIKRLRSLHSMWMES